jgi:hypothetical protein
LNAIARSLWARGDDRDFLADESIDERGFARVGSSDDGGEAGFEIVGHFIWASLKWRDWCAATRRLTALLSLLWLGG